MHNGPCLNSLVLLQEADVAVSNMRMRSGDGIFGMFHDDEESDEDEQRDEAGGDEGLEAADGGDSGDSTRESDEQKAPRQGSVKWVCKKADYRLYKPRNAEEDVPTVREAAHALLAEKRKGNMNDTSFDSLCSLLATKIVPRPNMLPRCDTAY